MWVDHGKVTMQISVNKNTNKARTIGRDGTTGKLRMCGFIDIAADIQPMKTNGCIWNMKVNLIFAFRQTFHVTTRILYVLRILAANGQKKAKILSFLPNFLAKKVTFSSVSASFC